MTTGTRKAGEFCWINMLTPNPAQARDFFGKLLGWTYVEMPGMGHRIQVAGRDIGGLFDLESPQTPKGTPPLIGVMVKVESADATVAKVEALGGKAKPAFDIMDQGRMAVCFDPNGAAFDVWEAKKGPGMDADSEAHGAPSWFETLTTDVERAKKFYAELFGWVPQSMAMEGFAYTTFKLGDAYVAGLMQLTPDMGNLWPHWGTYFTVRDADATAREAEALGATICVPAQDVPNVGRFCGITSPQGVTFFVIKYAQ
jgi:predicted enzyme related to lactoylglutathione lyase